MTGADSIRKAERVGYTIAAEIHTLPGPAEGENCADKFGAGTTKLDLV